MFAWLFLDVQREEKGVEKAIKEAAKRNDMGSAKVLLLKTYLFSLLYDFKYTYTYIYIHIHIHICGVLVFPRLEILLG